MSNWDDDDDIGTPTPLVVPIKKSWEDEEDIEGWEEQEESKPAAPGPPAVPVVIQTPTPAASQDSWRVKKDEPVSAPVQKTNETTGPAKPWHANKPQTTAKAPEPTAKLMSTPAKGQAATKPQTSTVAHPQVIKEGANVFVLVKEVEDETKKKETIKEEKPEIKAEGNEQKKEENAKAKEDVKKESTAVEKTDKRTDKERNEDILRNLEPKNDADFLMLARAIATQTDKYMGSSHYRNFIKELAKQLTDPLTTDDLNEILTGLNVILNEKLKASKVVSKGKAKKAKKKLNVTKGSEANLEEEENDYDEYDEM